MDNDRVIEYILHRNITKIKTTMVGAIADIEDLAQEYENDFLWEHFEDLKNSIFSRGNKQIRELNKEIEDYRTFLDNYGEH